MDVVHSELNSSTAKYPDGWTSLKISSSATLKARIGWQGLTTAEYLETGDYYLVTGTEFLNGAIDWDSCFFVDFERYKQDKNIQVNINDVLVTKDGTIGKVAIVESVDKPATLNSGVFVIRPINQSFHPKYFYHVLTSAYFKDFLNKLSAGSTINHLYQKDFVTFEFPAPQKPQEQEVIADALSDADLLIESLETLIEKKHRIKQGAMQELLTGKKRLPEFSGEWSEKEIREVVLTPVTDGPHLTPDFVVEGIPFLSVNNIVNNQIDTTDLRFISKFDDDVFARKCKPKKDDILLGKAASVGKVALVETDWDFNIWSPIALIRLSPPHSSKFVYYQLQSEYVIKQIKLLTNSSSQGNIGMGDIEKIKLKLPELEEQLEMAKIFGDMDLELAELEAKLTKARQIKQGMMQQLLTGNIRLIPSA